MQPGEMKQGPGLQAFSTFSVRANLICTALAPRPISALHPPKAHQEWLNKRDGPFSDDILTVTSVWHVLVAAEFAEFYAQEPPCWSFKHKAKSFRMRRSLKKKKKKHIKSGWKNTLKMSSFQQVWWSICGFGRRQGRRRGSCGNPTSSITATRK